MRSGARVERVLSDERERWDTLSTDVDSILMLCYQQAATAGAAGKGAAAATTTAAAGGAYWTDGLPEDHAFCVLVRKHEEERAERRAEELRNKYRKGGSGAVGTSVSAGPKRRPPAPPGGGGGGAAGKGPRRAPPPPPLGGAGAGIGVPVPASAGHPAQGESTAEAGVEHVEDCDWEDGLTRRQHLRVAARLKKAMRKHSLLFQDVLDDLHSQFDLDAAAGFLVREQPLPRKALHEDVVENDTFASTPADRQRLRSRIAAVAGSPRGAPRRRVSSRRSRQFSLTPGGSTGSASQGGTPRASKRVQQSRRHSASVESSPRSSYSPRSSHSPRSSFNDTPRDSPGDDGDDGDDEGGQLSGAPARPQRRKTWCEQRAEELRAALGTGGTSGMDGDGRSANAARSLGPEHNRGEVAPSHTGGSVARSRRASDAPALGAAAGALEDPLHDDVDGEDAELRALTAKKQIFTLAQDGVQRDIDRMKTQLQLLQWSEDEEAKATLELKLADAESKLARIRAELTLADVERLKHQMKRLAPQPQRAEAFDAFMNETEQGESHFTERHSEKIMSSADAVAVVVAAAAAASAAGKSSLAEASATSPFNSGQGGGDANGFFPEPHAPRARPSSADGYKPRTKWSPMIMPNLELYRSMSLSPRATGSDGDGDAHIDDLILNRALTLHSAPPKPVTEEDHAKVAAATAAAAAAMAIIQETDGAKGLFSLPTVLEEDRNSASSTPGVGRVPGGGKHVRVQSARPEDKMSMQQRIAAEAAAKARGKASANNNGSAGGATHPIHLSDAAKTYSSRRSSLPAHLMGTKRATTGLSASRSAREKAAFSKANAVPLSRRDMMLRSRMKSKSHHSGLAGSPTTIGAQEPTSPVVGSIGMTAASVAAIAGAAAAAGAGGSGHRHPLGTPSAPSDMMDSDLDSGTDGEASLTPSAAARRKRLWRKPSESSIMTSATSNTSASSKIGWSARTKKGLHSTAPVPDASRDRVAMRRISSRAAKATTAAAAAATSGAGRGPGTAGGSQHSFFNSGVDGSGGGPGTGGELRQLHIPRTPGKGAASVVGQMIRGNKEPVHSPRKRGSAIALDEMEHHIAQQRLESERSVLFKGLQTLVSELRLREEEGATVDMEKVFALAQAAMLAEASERAVATRSSPRAGAAAGAATPAVAAAATPAATTAHLDGAADAELLRPVWDVFGAVFRSQAPEQPVHVVLPPKLPGANADSVADGEKADDGGSSHSDSEWSASSWSDSDDDVLAYNSDMSDSFLTDQRRARRRQHQNRRRRRRRHRRRDHRSRSRSRDASSADEADVATRDEAQQNTRHSIGGEEVDRLAQQGAYSDVSSYLSNMYGNQQQPDPGLEDEARDFIMGMLNPTAGVQVWREQQGSQAVSAHEHLSIGPASPSMGRVHSAPMDDSAIALRSPAHARVGAGRHGGEGGDVQGNAQQSGKATPQLERSLSTGNMFNDLSLGSRPDSADGDPRSLAFLDDLSPKKASRRQQSQRSTPSHEASRDRHPFAGTASKDDVLDTGNTITAEDGRGRRRRKERSSPSPTKTKTKSKQKRTPAKKGKKKKKKKKKKKINTARTNTDGERPSGEFLHESPFGRPRTVGGRRHDDLSSDPHLATAASLDTDRGEYHVDQMLSALEQYAFRNIVPMSDTIMELDDMSGDGTDAEGGGGDALGQDAEDDAAQFFGANDDGKLRDSGTAGAKGNGGAQDMHVQGEAVGGGSERESSQSNGVSEHKSQPLGEEDRHAVGDKKTSPAQHSSHRRHKSRHRTASMGSSTDLQASSCSNSPRLQSPEVSGQRTPRSLDPSLFQEGTSGATTVEQEVEAQLYKRHRPKRIETPTHPSQLRQHAAQLDEEAPAHPVHHYRSPSHLKRRQLVLSDEEVDSTPRGQRLQRTQSQRARSPPNSTASSEPQWRAHDDVTEGDHHDEDVGTGRESDGGPAGSSRGMLSRVKSALHFSRWRKRSSAAASMTADIRAEMARDAKASSGQSSPSASSAASAATLSGNRRASSNT